ncbi:hypothetical protein C0V72_03535 [Porphyrobacter sp. TH134]|uniref:TadE/TadG family type IV pilus assembly protein n=1 Tax=Porphyrobacter sp. TH134 TaxID=2067450 RepID=UPI000C7AF422|nr:TadE/TadG family type IV pilus assembly protein [Porphyrobacter sp. TH134]PLK25077.1 hypothetical protein C0V72_03535 [Porphyrobacter sp. TH134]
MGQEKQANMPFMRRLLRDKTANTLAISAAALVPLMAMVGGGVDASRYYMAAARMQSACDAGALAARKAMTGIVLTTANQQVGFNFFDQNFSDGTFGVTNRTRNYTANNSGVVTGTATGVLPTTIMAAFGYNQFNLSVTCSADQNISNTDIMFVLDVTGSMNCPEDRVDNCPGGGNNNNSEASNSLIVGLRAAVVSFYDSIALTASTASRVRYGFMPYSNAVNVGFDLPVSYLASSHSYQSRVPIFNSNAGFSQYRYCLVTTGVANNCSYTPATGLPGWGSVNLSTLYTNANKQIQMPTGTNGTWETITWRGCIEEASTTNASSFNPVPTDANDLNINLIPTTEAQRWKPMLNRAVWMRFNSDGDITRNNVTKAADEPTWRADRTGWDVCVPRARKLQVMTKAEVQTYVNGLVALGGTYHDIGMIWGARYLSPRGIFASENQTAPNGQAISRHIVFMTDGLLAPNRFSYTPYGIEPWDRRITTNGGQDQMNARHEARFQAACAAAKAENITVWVVAFGTDLTTSLRNCASPDRAFEADNNADLNNAFQRIASQIAALRLTS